MNKNKYTVTAALPYANGPLHLGHVAGVYLPADIFVRFLRTNGHDVAFICGSDEHGAAITLRAKKEGITPREIVDKYNKIIGDSFKIDIQNVSNNQARLNPYFASNLKTIVWSTQRSLLPNLLYTSKF